MKKRIGILTGGGDVQSLNAVISGARNKAINKNIELVGIIKGWEGAIEADYVNLSNVSIKPQIGGTIIKSSRANINKVKNGPQVILDNFHKNNITGLIVIGGEDTLSNAFHIQSFPQILISKTIDNDVGKIEDKGEELKFENIINYFTLGFPTAAEKISSFVSLKEGLRTTAYSHERIIVVESMGMHAGWLALSSGMGSPDFVIIPEFPLDYDLFLDKVFKRYKSQRHMIIVIAEGAKWRTGSYIYTEKDENEDFDHPRFGGPAQALKTRLKKDLAKYFNIRNINSVNPSYLYRAGAPNDLDQHWAKRLGEMAVKYLSEGMNESIFLSIQRYDSGFKVKDIPLSRFNSIEQLHRFVDKRFYDPQEFQMTEQGRKYLRNIIKEFPLEKEYGLSNIKVN